MYLYKQISGDKTVQCGRKIDAFKFWMLWKSRGMVGMEKHVDRSFENTRLEIRELLQHLPTKRTVPALVYILTEFL